jgi:hypothetical protein
MSVLAKSALEICKANTNTSTAKYQYSFSKARRFPIPNLAEEIREQKLQAKLDKGEQLPVPIRKSKYEFYSLPSTLSTRKTTFGKGKKYDFTKVGNNCKEACYNFRSDFDKAHPHGPMYSFTKADRSGRTKKEKKKKEGEEENKEGDKKKEEVDLDGPGPAKYNYLKPFGYDAPKVTMKGRYTSKKAENEAVESEKKVDPSKLSQVTIQIRTTGKYIVSQIPNVNSLKFDKDKSKRTQFDSNKNPGPDKYKIPPLICNKVIESQYRNYERIRISGRTAIKDSRSNYPGPGSYPIPSDFGQYVSKDADKYPKENVYVEERPKFEEKAWRHNMKVIKETKEEDNNNNYEDQNKYNNEEETPGNEDNNYNEKQESIDHQDYTKQEEEEKKKEDKKREEEEEEEEKKKEDKKREEEEEEEDITNELVLLRDLLVYKEGEAQENDVTPVKTDDKKEDKEEDKKEEVHENKIEEKKEEKKEETPGKTEEKTEEKNEEKKEEKKEEDKESEAIMLRDILTYQ